MKKSILIISILFANIFILGHEKPNLSEKKETKTFFQRHKKVILGACGTVLLFAASAYGYNKYNKSFKSPSKIDEANTTDLLKKLLLDDMTTCHDAYSKEKRELAQAISHRIENIKDVELLKKLLTHENLMLNDSRFDLRYRPFVGDTSLSIRFSQAIYSPLIQKQIIEKLITLDKNLLLDKERTLYRQYLEQLSINLACLKDASFEKFNHSYLRQNLFPHLAPCSILELFIQNEKNINDLYYCISDLCSNRVALIDKWVDSLEEDHSLAKLPKEVCKIIGSFGLPDQYELAYSINGPIPSISHTFPHLERLRGNLFSTPKKIKGPDRGEYWIDNGIMIVINEDGTILKICKEAAPKIEVADE